jgi:hypothetical protein
LRDGREEFIRFLRDVACGQTGRSSYVRTPFKSHSAFKLETGNCFRSLKKFPFGPKLHLFSGILRDRTRINLPTRNKSGERFHQRFQGQANLHTNHLGNFICKQSRGYCDISETGSASCASLVPAAAVPEPVAATRVTKP